MTREHKRKPQTSTHQSTDITGIGVMGMNPIRTPMPGLEMKHQLIRQLIEMGPELLLA